MSSHAARINRRVRGEKAQMYALIPIVNEEEGRMDIQCISWEVCASDLSFAHLYDKAHALMPGPGVPSLTRPLNTERIDSACAILARTDASENEILRALGILGHSPCLCALMALEKFGVSTHSLAPVGRLAQSECEALLGCYSRIVAQA